MRILLLTALVPAVPTGSEHDANVVTTTSSSSTSTFLSKTITTHVATSTSSTKSFLSHGTKSGNDYLSYNDDIREKCSEIGFGRLALTEYIGFIVCEGGEPTSIEHCETGTMYDIESEACYDYCAAEKERRKRSSRLGSGQDNVVQTTYVVLPNLAGILVRQLPRDREQNVLIANSRYALLLFAV